ncbi:MAG: ELWxxDGT repeat protein [Bellilinea sp.]
MRKYSFVRRFPSLATLARACLCAALLAGVRGITAALAATPKPEPYLVEDIYPGIGGSEPYYLTAVGNTLFFVAIDETHGDELWRSDGTEAGTVMVKDIFPGKFNSHPENLINVNGTLFFRASDGIHGEELWRSDGTEAGTVMVKDIIPGSGGSAGIYNPDWVVFDGKVFFIANDGVHGDELWRSDGTEAGTELVKDIYTGVNGSQMIFITPTTDVLYLGARDETHGTELWRSDGTEAGTELVKDINAGASDSLFTYYIDHWLAIDNTLFFIASDGINGFELWRSNGAEDNTVLVKDIYPGGMDSNPTNLTDVNGVILFSAYSPGHGNELWRSDGMAENTVMVKDIFPGGLSSVPGYNSEGWPVVNHTAFFIATDGISGYELWRSDGTAEGTVLVKDINPGYYGSEPRWIINLGGRLFFTAENVAYGEELWQSDGTEAGTELVKDIYPGSAGSRPRFLTNVTGRLFFTASNYDYNYYYFLASQQAEAVPEIPFGVELWSIRHLTYVPLVVK